MIVDDDDLIRKYAALLLESAGYQVTGFARPKEALTSLQSGMQPDLFFTDVLLDGHMSGVQLAKLARSIFPSLKVLYASGYAHPECFDEVPEDFYFLPKPYSRQKVLETVSRIIAI